MVDALLPKLEFPFDAPRLAKDLARLRAMLVRKKICLRGLYYRREPDVLTVTFYGTDRPDDAVLSDTRATFKQWSSAALT